MDRKKKNFYPLPIEIYLRDFLPPSILDCMQLGCGSLATYLWLNEITIGAQAKIYRYVMRPK